MSLRAATFVCLLVTFTVIDICRETDAKAPPRQSNPDTVTIVVPAFFSEPPQLGLSVTTILHLQIWKTLRKAPEKNPEKLSFGKGQVFWYVDTPEEPTHEAAAKVAMPDSAQIVLWGKAYALGGGSSVMAYLTLPTIRDSPLQQFEMWKLKLNVAGKDYDVVADVPARQYAFEPIFLPDKLVSTYSSVDALTIYKTRTGKKKIGPVALTSDLFATRWEEDAVRVSTGKTVGWLRLPHLSRTTEVVDFVGGLMRIFRADWDGALELLSRVVSNTQTPMALRIDSNLLMARAAYQLGRDFEPYLLDAEKFDRFSKRIVRYRVMGMLAGLESADAGQLVDKAAATREYLDARAHLFSADDKWLLRCRELLAAFTKR
jgi:hypothetical protein